MQEEQTTLESVKNELLEAINGYADKIEVRLIGVEGAVNRLDDRLTGVEGAVNRLDVRLTGVEGAVDRLGVRLTRVESLMVTKDYLDDKMADLRGDVLTVLRKEDTRLTRLVEKLREKNLFDEHDVEELLRLQPLVPIPN